MLFLSFLDFFLWTFLWFFRFIKLSWRYFRLQVLIDQLDQPFGSIEHCVCMLQVKILLNHIHMLLVNFLTTYSISYISFQDQLNLLVTNLFYQWRKQQQRMTLQQNKLKKQSLSSLTTQSWNNYVWQSFKFVADNCLR